MWCLSHRADSTSNDARRFGDWSVFQQQAIWSFFEGILKCWSMRSIYYRIWFFEGPTKITSVLSFLVFVWDHPDSSWACCPTPMTSMVEPEITTIHQWLFALSSRVLLNPMYINWAQIQALDDYCFPMFPFYKSHLVYGIHGYVVYPMLTKRCLCTSHDSGSISTTGCSPRTFRIDDGQIITIWREGGSLNQGLLIPSWH